MSDYTKLWKFIIENSIEEDLRAELDEVILAEVDKDFMKESGYDDEFVFYSDYYSDVAETIVLREKLIIKTMNELNLNLSYDDIERMYEALRELYCIWLKNFF